MVQSFNTDGVLTCLRLWVFGPSALKPFSPTSSYLQHRLAKRGDFFTPHLHVKDINEIDFAALKRAGCEGILFDKDHTVTWPYDDKVHPAIQKAWDACREHITRRWIVSNSIGTTVDDPHGAKAEHMSKTLDCPVLRYTGKKPVQLDASTLGFEPTRGAIVGDRLMTDIFMGHQMGMLTILVDPLLRPETETPLKSDNRAAGLLRKLEQKWLMRQAPRNYATDHPLLTRYRQEMRNRM